MKFRVKYPNLTFLGLSIVTAVALSYFGVFERVLGGLGELGRLGAFFAGAIFPLTFTSPIAAAVLFYLGSQYGALETVLFGVMGALIGDLILFSFVKSNILKEIDAIRAEYKENHPKHRHHRRKAIIKLFHRRAFHSLGLFMGALLLIIPGPDELGIAVLATYKLKTRSFAVTSLIMNAISIWIVATAGEIIKG